MIGADVENVNPVGRIPELLDSKLPRGVNAMLPTTLSLTEATEFGTLYGPDRIGELAAIAARAGLRTHLDGARFGNAVAELGCTAADLTWRAGVDIVAFGAMKNGTFGAETVLCFDNQLAEKLAILHKRAGQLSPKQRYLAAQLLAILEDDLWIANAKQANTNAHRIAEALDASDHANLLLPVETNQVFCALTSEMSSKLDERGLSLRRWSPLGETAYRMVFSFADDEKGIKELAEILRSGPLVGSQPI